MEKLKAQCSGKKQGIGKIWLKNYALAKKYYEQHGDLNVPGKTKLSRWLSEQRYAKKGKRGGLSPEKIALLEEIGMIWESQRNLTWMWYYEHARRYYETHGILNVGCNYVDADGCRLGQWLTRQRKAYRLKRSGAERKKHQPMLTDREEKLLEELGVQWDLTWLGRYVSVPEIAVFYYLRRYYPDTIKLSSGDFLKCEIDVYVPSLKVGIEYDGVAWHKGKKERDERKGILCRKHGIRLTWNGCMTGTQIF